MPDQPNVIDKEEDFEPPEISPEPDTGIGLAAELLIGLLVTGFALFVIIESLCMPHRAKAFIMDPGFVPLISGIALLALVCILDVRAIRSGGAAHVRDLFRMIKAEEESRRFWWILGFVTVYIVVLIGRVPFVLATAAFLAGIFIYLKVGAWWKIAFYTVICTALVSIILPELFSIPLP